MGPTTAEPTTAEPTTPEPITTKEATTEAATTEKVTTEEATTEEATTEEATTEETTEKEETTVEATTVETTTEEVTKKAQFPVGDQGAVTEYFQVVVKAQTSLEWDDKLADSSSDLFQEKATEVKTALENEPDLSENALGFKVVIKVVSFAKVSSGRKRDAGDTGAEIQYSGETSFPETTTAIALQDALVAATDEAAEDNAILTGQTVVEEIINAGSSKLIPSLLILVVSMIFLNF